MSKIPVKRYQLMKRRYPEFMAAVENLGTAAASAGPLDERTKELIQLAAAAAAGLEGAVHSHARRALQAGATPEAVCHTLLVLTSTIGFPTVVAALSWVDDVLEPKAAAKSSR